MRLAIITTHPIQYYAPLFQLLNDRGVIEIKVFYTWGEQAMSSVYDPGFGKERKWDIPLLEGYNYEFVRNVSSSPGSHHFKGIVNPDLIKRINHYNADALLVFGWAFNSHLKVLRHFKGKLPVYFRGDSTLLDEPGRFSLKKLMRRIFLTWVYSHVDVVFYVGTNNKKYFLVHGLKERQLVYAPHAIDNDRFAGNPVVEDFANEWKESLGIPSHTLTVLFAGKLEIKKNPKFLVEAARQMKDLHFVIAGDGVLENELKDAAKGINNISFLPFQNQSSMPALYRLADVFVLPSQGPGETWGLAINEAMASGLAVIASNKCGGATDLIKDGENGFVISPVGNELINALRRMASDKTRLEEFKENSLKTISKFSYEKIALALEQTLIHNTRNK